MAVTLLSIGGTVAMASAATTHASAAPVRVAVSAPAPLDLPPTSAGNAAGSEPFPPSHVGHPRPATTTPPSTSPPVPATAPPVTAAHTAPPPVPAQQAEAIALRTRSTAPAAPALASADTCAAALAYLGAHSAPGFQFECPGNALGHQAMTCVDVAGVCPGYKLIVISDVCPASYMNEAHNSWILSGLATGSIDPYGYCH